VSSFISHLTLLLPVPVLNQNYILKSLNENLIGLTLVYPPIVDTLVRRTTMTMGKPTRRTRPYVQRKPDSYIALWRPRIGQYISEMCWKAESERHEKPEFLKVSIIQEWLDERYITFRNLKPIFKKIVIGKCLKELGCVRYARGEQGIIYRREQ